MLQFLSVYDVGVTEYFGTSPYDPAVRLSDAERTAAMNQLAQAVGEGRLTIAEFEERSDDVMQAQTRGELVPVFAGIPAMGSQELKVYSQGDIDRARAASRKPRLATALVGSGVLTFSSIAFFMTADAGLGLLPALGGVASIFLIPMLWIMLYVAKVGPDSWHTPSPRAIERQRQKEIQAMTALQRAERKEIEAAMWADRRRQAAEVAADALELAKRKLNEINREK